MPDDDLIGRRYAGEFTVLDIEPPTPDRPEETALLFSHGDVFALAVGELRHLIDSGLVSEVRKDRDP